ncbi:MAG TPA: PAS domain S-box protein [Thermoanaerobaculia bacterium]|jgi:PAS domain S-box-containing protein|nr:PAS domain S-box protein [Thermoanaerobaculia bacterium]
MNPTLRVLLVEDSETDAKLVIHTLRAAGYDLESERVEEAEALIAALHRGVWDVVISDWTLPQFGARDALAIVRAADPDMPFIIVSGTAGEDQAVAAMHAGAQDYIFKGNLARLVPAIERELRESQLRAAHRKTQQALRVSEARYRALFEFSPLPKWLYDVKTLRFLEVNQAAVRHYGYSREEFLRMSVTDIRPPEDVEAVIRDIEDARRTVEPGPVSFGVWRHRKKDGTLIDVEITGHAFDLEGTWVRAIAAHDITERLRAEHLLRASEERHRLLLDSTAEAIYGIDNNGNCTFSNRACARLLGYESADGLLGQHMHNLMHHTKPDGTPFPETECRIYRAFQRGEGTHVDDELFWRADGTAFPAEYFSYPIKQASNLIGAVVTFLDITEKRRAEESARAMAAERSRLLGQLRFQIERMPLLYILFDADFRVADWNPAAQRTLGYTKEEALGKQPNDLNPPSFHRDAAAIMERIRTGDMAAHSVNENLTKDGRIITCEWFNTPLMTDDGRFGGLLCLGRDVTDEKVLEAQLQQAQKMEAIGQLAGGVAHDFNNLLTIISGYSDILLATLGPNDALRECVEEISAAGQRAASLTRQLLAFSRKTVLEPKVLDLNHTVRETEKLLRRLIGEDVSLTAVLDPNIGRVKVDPGHLAQVLMNLAVNARDAMPRGGQLTVETSNVELDQGYSRLHHGVQPGRYVLLSITDSGCGMTEDVKARIFEPFFTTKGVGKGTGLGLSVVLGIVKQSGGHVAVESEPDAGTTFEIYFPAVEEQVSAANGVDDLSQAQGTETVLLAEDEEGVRRLAALVLRSHGYEVLSAGSGGEALGAVENRQGGIDLLVTDVVMPGMSGPDLAEALQSRFPQVKVLFTSGFTDDAVVRHGVLHEQVAFLQKPYSPLALVRKVRQLLDERAGSKGPA